MDVGTFFGQTLSVAGVSAAVTQIFKVAEKVHPLVARIPVIGKSLAWLIDTITPEDPGAIQIFVGFLCFVLNLASSYIRDGYVQVDLLILLQTLTSFLQATGAYTLILKRFNVKTEPVA